MGLCDGYCPPCESPDRPQQLILGEGRIERQHPHERELLLRQLHRRAPHEHHARRRVHPELADAQPPGPAAQVRATQQRLHAGARSSG